MCDKPIIRHCKNCKYYQDDIHNYECTIRYVFIYNYKLRALFCKYYKEKKS